MKFSGVQWILVKLHRPPPEMRIFFPDARPVRARRRDVLAGPLRSRTSARPPCAKNQGIIGSGIIVLTTWSHRSQKYTVPATCFFIESAPDFNISERRPRSS
jgi:hypothetical protein